ncbi:hypothetical protein EOK75_02705 [Pseudorhodobacter turbinis]|uniref:Uncharacterized protein n=1 Tax=Pseudorhodobacter turbinis TaxID=2500533 RepID=A0A4P8EDN2_9RHOB|nr:super-infection exclusion protein B [Pseudorhodobacter turbinis]QCO54797.1 hypothetical protein EOK75_02705 [Pseudorhodobacter turbinis]
MDFSLKSALDFFVNAAPKPTFLIFVVSTGLTFLFFLNPDLLPDWPKHVDAVAFWAAIVSGLLLLGIIIWEGFDPVRRKVLRWEQRRKELKTLLGLTIDEVAAVSLYAQFRKKTLPIEKHHALTQSLESKGIIKRTFACLLAEGSTAKPTYYSPPEPDAFEFVDTIWQLIVVMDEFKVDAEALRDAINDGKRGDDLRVYLSPKHPTVSCTM